MNVRRYVAHFFPCTIATPHFNRTFNIGHSDEVTSPETTESLFFSSICYYCAFNVACFVDNNR